jgi:hypothetical protein
MPSAVITSGSSMQQSRVIEVDGVFLAAAVALSNAQGWRIVAADPRVVGLDGRIVASLQDARRLARQAFQAARVLPMLAAEPQEGKMFFFEKKNQKTFANLGV